MLLYFVLFFHFHLCTAFITMDSCHEQYMEPYLQSSYHHTQITRSSVCKVQQSWIEKNLGINLTNPSALSLDCPLLDWFQSSSSVKEIAPDLSSQAQRANKEIGESVTEVDLIQQMATDASYHFESDRNSRSSNELLQSLRAKVIASLTVNDDQEARKQLGYALHIVQDFYSHTNWVEEFGADGDIFEDLGTDMDANQAVKFYQKFADVGVKTCIDCNSELNETEQRQLKAFVSGLHEGSNTVWTPNFQANNVKVCHDNILHTNTVTTSYNGWSSMNKDSGKCGAGGGIDFLTSSAPVGGIAKDSASFLFSPHFYLHEMAAQLAYKASIAFIKQIEAEVEADAFGSLLGIGSRKAVVFVSDQPKSLNAVKDDIISWAESYAGIDIGGLLIGTAFLNHGSITVYDQTTDAKKFANFLINATNEANASSRIPEEKGVLDVLLHALNHCPFGAQIIVLSDVNIKNADLFSPIIALAHEKQTRISFIKKQGTHCGTVKKNNLADCSMYNVIAKTTGGLFVVAPTKSALVEAMKAVATEHSITYLLREKVKPSLNFSGEWSFVVDSNVDRIEIIFGSTPEIDTNKLLVFDPNGSQQIINDTNVDNKLFALVANNPSIGKWTVKIDKGFYLTDRLTTYLIVRGIDSLEWAYEINEAVKDGRWPGLVATEGLPIVGEKYILTVECLQCATIDSIKLTCDSTIIEINPTSCAGKKFIAKVIFPIASYPYSIEILGRNLKNESFHRIDVRKIWVSVIDLKVNAIAFSVAGETTTIPFEIKNLAVNETYNVKVVNDQGWVLDWAPKTEINATNKTIVGTIAIQTPETKMKNGYAMVRLTVASQSDPYSWNSKSIRLALSTSNVESIPLSIQKNASNTSSVFLIDIQIATRGDALYLKTVKEVTINISNLGKSDEFRIEMSDKYNWTSSLTPKSAVLLFNQSTTITALLYVKKYRTGGYTPDESVFSITVTSTSDPSNFVSKTFSQVLLEDTSPPYYSITEQNFTLCEEAMKNKDPSSCNKEFWSANVAIWDFESGISAVDWKTTGADINPPERLDDPNFSIEVMVHMHLNGDCCVKSIYLKAYDNQGQTTDIDIAEKKLNLTVNDPRPLLYPYVSTVLELQGNETENSTSPSTTDYRTAEATTEQNTYGSGGTDSGTNATEQTEYYAATTTLKSITKTTEFLLTTIQTHNMTKAIILHIDEEDSFISAGASMTIQAEITLDYFLAIDFLPVTVTDERHWVDGFCMFKGAVREWCTDSDSGQIEDLMPGETRKITIWLTGYGNVGDNSTITLAVKINEAYAFSQKSTQTLRTSGDRPHSNSTIELKMPDKLFIYVHGDGQIETTMCIYDFINQRLPINIINQGTVEDIFTISITDEKNWFRYFNNPAQYSWIGNSVLLAPQENFNVCIPTYLEGEWTIGNHSAINITVTSLSNPFHSITRAGVLTISEIWSPKYKIERENLTACAKPMVGIKQNCAQRFWQAIVKVWDSKVGLKSVTFNSVGGKLRNPEYRNITNGYAFRLSGDCCVESATVLSINNHNLPTEVNISQLWTMSNNSSPIDISITDLIEESGNCFHKQIFNLEFRITNNMQASGFFNIYEYTNIDFSFPYNSTYKIYFIFVKSGETKTLQLPAISYMPNEYFGGEGNVKMNVETVLIAEPPITTNKTATLRLPAANKSGNSVSLVIPSLQNGGLLLSCRQVTPFTIIIKNTGQSDGNFILSIIDYYNRVERYDPKMAKIEAGESIMINGTFRAFDNKDHYSSYIDLTVHTGDDPFYETCREWQTIPLRLMNEEGKCDWDTTENGNSTQNASVAVNIDTNGTCIISGKQKNFEITIFNTGESDEDFLIDIGNDENWALYYYPGSATIPFDNSITVFGYLLGVGNPGDSLTLRVRVILAHDSYDILFDSAINLTVASNSSGCNENETSIDLLADIETHGDQLLYGLAQKFEVTVTNYGEQEEFLFIIQDDYNWVANYTPDRALLSTYESVTIQGFLLGFGYSGQLSTIEVKVASIINPGKETIISTKIITMIVDDTIWNSTESSTSIGTSTESGNTTETSTESNNSTANNTDIRMDFCINENGITSGRRQKFSIWVWTESYSDPNTYNYFEITDDKNWVQSYDPKFMTLDAGGRFNIDGLLYGVGQVGEESTIRLRITDPDDILIAEASTVVTIINVTDNSTSNLTKTVTVNIVGSRGDWLLKKGEESHVFVTVINDGGERGEEFIIDVWDSRRWVSGWTTDAYPQYPKAAYLDVVLYTSAQACETTILFVQVTSVPYPTINSVLANKTLIMAADSTPQYKIKHENISECTNAMKSKSDCNQTSWTAVVAIWDYKSGIKNIEWSTTGADMNRPEGNHKMSFPIHKIFKMRLSGTCCVESVILKVANRQKSHRKIYLYNDHANTEHALTTEVSLETTRRRLFADERLYADDGSWTQC